MEKDIVDKGVVISVDGDIVEIEIVRGEGCDSCSMHGLCFPAKKTATMRIHSDLALEKGDVVELEVAPGSRIVASLFVFAMPVVFLFVGFIVASFFFSELISIAIGFASLGISFFIVKLCDRKWGKDINVKILRKL
ncbi:MAG: SoxR reducing system RseC family protein [Candidatus Cloacimonetes bacterium]|nr:SoxR reducing system RseC family protein [Candidatus Cloacimonadota bacterium]